MEILTYNTSTKISLYIDDSKMGENGLFGAVIVNPKNNTVDALADGRIQQLSLDKIDKDIVIFMVGSTFWGMEIDKKKNDVQIPLWTNPEFTAIQDQKIRFHVLGIGHEGHPTGHRHTFHLHAHRWPYGLTEEQKNPLLQLS